MMASSPRLELTVRMEIDEFRKKIKLIERDIFFIRINYMMRHPAKTLKYIFRKWSK